MDMIGKVVVFGYEGETRQVKVETVNMTPKKGLPCFGGWDVVNEGYRSFHIDKANSLKVVG